MGTQVANSASSSPMAYGAKGVELQTFEDAYRFAKCVVASGFAPKGMDKPEAVVIAVQMGAEIGLSPMQALQNIAVINGRPSVWGDAMLAICRASGYFDESAFSEMISGEGEKAIASCTVRRLPTGQLATRTFSVLDAKKAGLWAKQGPWTQYPNRMLQMRARSFALRDTFSDVLRGLSCREEAQDIITVEPTKVTRLTPVDEFMPAASTQMITTDGEIIERSDSDTPQPAREEFALNGSNE